MQWWMWVIAVLLGLVGLFLWFCATGGEAIFFVIGCVFIAVAVTGSLYYQTWRPEQHREHARALTEVAKQGFVTISANDNTYDVTAYAGNCLIPLYRRKVNGFYRLEVVKRINLPQGAKAFVKAPIDKQFLADIGKLSVCQ